MSKTWYGHYIETIKGTDYVLFKDYLELDKEIERLNNIINELEKFLKNMQKEMENTPADNLREEMEKIGHLAVVDTILDKLQELKGSDK